MVPPTVAARLLLGAGGLWALAGCIPREEPPPPAGDTAGCSPDFVGDPQAEPELSIVHRTADGRMVEGVAGGPVELFFPPQGGKVFLTAARVRNVDACGLRVEAWLRDPCTERIIGFEGRPYQTRVDDEGWLVPLHEASLSSWANVPGCPSAAAERRVDGEVYELTVRIEDRDGRRAEQSMQVVPRCAEPGFRYHQCRCECSPEYRLGASCDPAGGDPVPGDPVPGDPAPGDPAPGGDAEVPELVCP